MDIYIRTPQKADQFASIFQNKDVADVVNIFFNKKQMFIQSMDKSSVILSEVYLQSTWFDQYDMMDESVTIGISSKILHMVLKTREKNQTIQLHYSSEESDKLFLYFHSEQKNEYDKNFELPLIDLTSDILEIPPCNYTAEVTYSSDRFFGIVSQLKSMGDTVDIRCSEEKIIFSSQSLEKGKMSIEMLIDEVESFAIEEGETIHISFSLRYMEMICSYHKIAKEVELKFISGKPICVTYFFEEDEEGEGEEEGESEKESKVRARILFYLSPKMDDDEED